MSEIDDLAELDDGDRVLFDYQSIQANPKTPLVVDRGAGWGGVCLRGPGGGRYELRETWLLHLPDHGRNVHIERLRLVGDARGEKA